MRAVKVSVLGVAVLVLALLFFLFKQSVFLFFQNLRMAFAGTADTSLSYQSLLDFKMAAEGLSSKNSTALSTSTMDGYRVIAADVFSSYPFNNYSLLIVNAGSDEGLAAGMPVLAGNNVLLGKVTSVSAHTSEVQTFFDPSWKSSVFVGDAKVNGLLDGGPSPNVDFIPKNATTSAGMAVTNADAGFPLGLLIGSVDSVQSINNNLWQSAKIKTLFDLSSLRRVFIVANFK